MKRPVAAIGPTEHLPSKVADFLTREIKSGRIAAENRLPPETKLASELGVSRNVVREAISQLRADGLVYVRQGAGAFALPPEESKVIRLDMHSLTDALELGNLFELRGILETEAAGLAAARIKPSGLDNLAKALERMRGSERTRDDSVQADLEFHREISYATGNDYIATFASFTASRIRESIYMARRARPVELVVGLTIAEHEQIFEALEKRDPESARLAMRIHIRESAIRAGARLPEHTEGVEDLEP